MFHQKIVAAETREQALAIEHRPAELDTAARLWSVAIVALLPLFLVGLLLQWLWNDIKKLGRAIGHFHRAVAEELSRPS